MATQATLQDPPAHTEQTQHSQSPMVGGFGFTTAVINNWHHVSYFKPTALDSGQYCISGWTYGYVQDKQFCVYANKGEIADIKVNFLIGVNITLDILFKKEHVITPTPFNMSARVRVFDDSGVLLGEWMTSQGTYVTGPGTATSATCGDVRRCLTNQTRASTRGTENIEGNAPIGRKLPTGRRQQPPRRNRRPIAGRDGHYHGNVG